VIVRLGAGEKTTPLKDNVLRDDRPPADELHERADWIELGDDLSKHFVFDSLDPQR
jgi:hypothetical protein